MFFSHPGRLLSDHITDVFCRSEEMLKQINVKFQDEWHGFIQTVSICHDFGKYLTYFQEFLLEKQDPGEIKNHSLLGALFSSYVFERLNENQQGNGAQNFLSLIIYLVVLRHHGHLVSIEKSFGFQSVGDYLIKYSKLEEQISNIRKNRGEIAEDIKVYAPQFSPFLEDFLEDYTLHIAKLKKQYHILKRYLRKSETNINLCVKLQIGFSLLIDADKHSAAGNQPVERKNVSVGCVEHYRNSVFSGCNIHSAINEKRNLIRDIVIKRIEELDSSKNFFTFTAPTGTGKTLTALESALLLRKRLMENVSMPTPRRIIYVLPFTSIIDQNYKVIKDVVCGKKTDQGLVLKHHHLSEVKYYSAGMSEDVSVEKQLMYVESWESEIIVTTYVQLIDTMLGVKNRQLKKLHNLAGAIVILDEVQNLPFKYWSLTEQLLKAYSEQFDNKWILLTATQPKIFPQSETIELLEDEGLVNSYFFEDDCMHRTKIIMKHKGYLPLEEWLDEASQYVKKYPSVLMVLNTIDTSVEVYKYFNNFRPSIVYYLSANMIPYHRRKTIREVKKRLEQNLPVILISTQVVEAGVDLDFHCVIRDIGPMDSIIQVAGRCNRHNLRDCGEVIVLPLYKEEKQKPDSSLYGIDAEIAREILEEFKDRFLGPIPERAYQQVVEKYYTRLTNLKQNDDSLMRLNQMAKLDFDALADFSLIEDRTKKWPVFIEYNKYATWVWNFYVNNVWNEENASLKKRNYLRCKSLLQEFTVQVEEKNLRKTEWECGYLFIHNEWICTGQYYSLQTGWVRDNRDEGAMLY